MSKKISPEIIKELKYLFEQKMPEAGIRRWFRETTGLKKTQGNAVFNQIKESLKNPNPDNSFPNEKPYHYNKLTRDYVFFLKSAGRNVVLHEDELQNVISAYSNTFGDERSVDDIGRMLGWPKNYVIEMLRLLDFSHDSLPVLPETLETKSDDEILTDLTTQKKFVIKQKFEKSRWQDIENKAVLWDKFRFSTFDPFIGFLKSWNPPEYKPYEIIKEKIEDGYSFIVVLNDLHFGSKANSKHMFRGKDQNTQMVVDSIRKYGAQIVSDIKNLKLKINKIVIVSLGDILHTASPFGTTTKGTPLRYDVLNEEMFTIAFDSLAELIINLSKIVPEVDVHSYKGNHFGTGDSVLFFALSKYLSAQKNIKFNICSSFAGSFVEKNTFFICSHGAADAFKSKAPQNAKLQTYIQSLIIHSQENFKGIKNRVALFADLHHLNIKEFNDFHYILAPSIMQGDEFADNLSLDAKPSQICLLLDDNGIKANFNYYF